MNSAGARGFGFRHHLAIGTDVGGCGLAARWAGVECRLVFFAHAGLRHRALALPFEKSPIEVLFRAWRFRFQPVQHLLIQQCTSSLSHGTFIHDVRDSIEDAVGGEFPFRQPIERFHLFRKPFNRGGECGALLVQIVFLPMQHVPEKASGFVIKIVPSCHHIIFLFNRDPIELVAFDRAAGTTGGAMDDLRQFLDPGTGFLFDRVGMECGSQR